MRSTKPLCNQTDVPLEGVRALCRFDESNDQCKARSVTDGIKVGGPSHAKIAEGRTAVHKCTTGVVRQQKQERRVAWQLCLYIKACGAAVWPLCPQKHMRVPRGSPRSSFCQHSRCREGALPTAGPWNQCCEEEACAVPLALELQPSTRQRLRGLWPALLTLGAPCCKCGCFCGGSACKYNMCTAEWPLEELHSKEERAGGKKEKRSGRATINVFEELNLRRRACCVCSSVPTSPGRSFRRRACHYYKGHQKTAGRGTYGYLP